MQCSGRENDRAPIRVPVAGSPGPCDDQPQAVSPTTPRQFSNRTAGVRYVHGSAHTAHAQAQGLACRRDSAAPQRREIPLSPDFCCDAARAKGEAARTVSGGAWGKQPSRGLKRQCSASGPAASESCFTKGMVARPRTGSAPVAASFKDPRFVPLINDHRRHHVKRNMTVATQLLVQSLH